jgi:hypothetical protein
VEGAAAAAGGCGRMPHGAWPITDHGGKRKRKAESGKGGGLRVSARRPDGGGGRALAPVVGRRAGAGVVR